MTFDDGIGIDDPRKSVLVVIMMTRWNCWYWEALFIGIDPIDVDDGDDVTMTVLSMMTVTYWQ